MYTPTRPNTSRSFTRLPWHTRIPLLDLALDACKYELRRTVDLSIIHTISSLLGALVNALRVSERTTVEGCGLFGTRDSRYIGERIWEEVGASQVIQ